MTLAHITQETSNLFTTLFVGGLACGVVTLIAIVVLVVWLVTRKKDDK